MPGNLISPVGPSPIFCYHGDALIVGATWGLNVTNPSTLVYYRMIVNGQRQEFTQTLSSTSSTPAFQNLQIPLPEGWLIGVTILGTASTVPQQGAISVQVGLARGLQGPIATNAQSAPISLISGCTGNYPLSWPYVGAANPVTQPGYLASVAVSNPSAGANLSYTLSPSIERWTFQNIRLKLVTSSTAGSRQVQLLFTDASGNVYFSAQAQCTQPASQTNTYSFSPGVGPTFQGAATATVAPAGADIQVPLPAILQANDATVISTVITNIQTGDQISAVVVRASLQHELD